MDAILDGERPRARLAVLLKHFFSQIDDERKPWRVVDPLAEVLLLLTCAAIASCDDFDDIVAWDEHHLDFLQRFSRFISASCAGCGGAMADKIVEHQADYLLTLKGNQPALEAEVADYFRSTPAEEVVSKTTIEKGHGRIDTRIYTASSEVDWIVSERSYPGEPRFTNIKTALKVTSRIEYADRCTFETRFYVSSAALNIDRLVNGAHGHGGVESMHGCSTWNSRTTRRAIAAVTGPTIWPSYAVSRSASSAPPHPREASKPEENQQAGTRPIPLSRLT